MISRASQPAVVALLAATTAAMMAACGLQSTPLPPAVRFTVPVPGDRTLNAFAVSADGRWLAYSAERDGDGLRRLFIRSVAEDATGDRELPGTAGASYSRSFRLTARLSRIFHAERSGAHRLQPPGSPQRVVDAPPDSAGGTWTADNRIVFAPLGNQGLMDVPFSRRYTYAADVAQPSRRGARAWLAARPW